MSIHVKVQLTAADFIDAHWAHRLRSRFSRLMHVVVIAWIAVMVLLIIQLAERDRHYLMFSLPLIGGLAGWAVMFFFSPYIFQPYQWRKTPSAKKEQAYTFDESGYTLNSADSEVKASWARVLKWTESKRLFLLYLGPLLYIPLPKRAFVAGQVEEMRKLLTANVKRA